MPIQAQDMAYGLVSFKVLEIEEVSRVGGAVAADRCVELAVAT